MHLWEKYASETLESCRYVSVPSTGEFAVNFMCGNNVAPLCTTRQFYDFLGNNPQSPFLIDFKLHADNDTDSEMTPPAMPTFPCWERPDVSCRLSWLCIVFHPILVYRTTPCPVPVWTARVRVRSHQMIPRNRLRWLFWAWTLTPLRCW